MDGFAAAPVRFGSLFRNRPWTWCVLIVTALVAGACSKMEFAGGDEAWVSKSTKSSYGVLRFNDTGARCAVKTGRVPVLREVAA